MKTLIRVVTLCLGLTMATGRAEEAPAVADKPLAVLVFAQWCFNCKQILPRLEPLQAEFGDRIHFDRLDVTNEEAKNGARIKARELGISSLYFANKGTGLVMLVNRDREKVGELRYTQTDAEMREKLEALAASD